MIERLIAGWPELGLLELDLPVHEEAPAVPRLFPGALLLGGADERALSACLDQLTAGDLTAAATTAHAASRAAAGIPDVHLLAGALLYGEGRFAQAVEALEQCRRATQDPPPESPVAQRDRRPELGLTARRIQPRLRLLVRVCPTLLLPLYPDHYAAGLLLALAYWRNGQLEPALEELRELAREYGLGDEIKLVAGQIVLERGEPDKAVATLSAPESATRDSVELARCLYLALAHVRRDEDAKAVQALLPALSLVEQANPHLRARARLLLAECYGRADMPLHALRQSGLVEPPELDRGAALALLALEQSWIEVLGEMDADELERQARADNSTLKMGKLPRPELSGSAGAWEVFRRKDADGAPVAAQDLSREARELRQRIEAAQQWWPKRRAALEQAEPGARLLREGAAEVEHLQVDFRGSREAPTSYTPGERRAAALAGLAGATLGVALVLTMVRSCFY